MFRFAGLFTFMLTLLLAAAPGVLVSCGTPQGGSGLFGYSVSGGEADISELIPIPVKWLYSPGTVFNREYDLHVLARRPGGGTDYIPIERVTITIEKDGDLYEADTYPFEEVGDVPIVNLAYANKKKSYKVWVVENADSPGSGGYPGSGGGGVGIEIIP